MYIFNLEFYFYFYLTVSNTKNITKRNKIFIFIYIFSAFMRERMLNSILRFNKAKFTFLFMIKYIFLKFKISTS